MVAQTSTASHLATRHGVPCTLTHDKGEISSVNRSHMRASVSNIPSCDPDLCATLNYETISFAPS